MIKKMLRKKNCLRQRYDKQGAVVSIEAVLL